MSSRKFYLYGETAFSHEGDIDYLIKSIDVAKQGKLDAIKFQVLIDAEESYTKHIRDSSEVFNYCFTEKQWLDVLSYAKEKKLEIIALPIDMRALDFISKNQALVDMIEVHSINFNHKYMLEYINDNISRRVILGVGGRTLSDIEYGLSQIPRVYSSGCVIFMYGFQSYPTDASMIKMGNIKRLREMYSVDVGYADHTSYDEDDTELIQAAYVNGARFFEKHLVLEKGVKRTDYQSAVDYSSMIEIRNKLERISLIQGTEGDFILNMAESKYRSREKQIVAKKIINAGEMLSKDNIGYKVSEDENKYHEQKDIEYLIGEYAKKQYRIDECVSI